MISSALKSILSKFLSNLDLPMPAGEYSVDQIITLRVKGNVRKGEDFPRPATVSIPFKSVLALFADRVTGIVQENQKEKVFQMLVESMQDCMNNSDEKVEKIKALMKNLEASEKAVKEKLIQKLPEQTVSGLTTIGKDFIVEVLQVESERVAV